MNREKGQGSGWREPFKRYARRTGAGERFGEDQNREDRTGGNRHKQQQQTRKKIRGASAKKMKRKRSTRGITDENPGLGVREVQNSGFQPKQARKSYASAEERGGGLCKRQRQTMETKCAMNRRGSTPRGPDSPDEYERKRKHGELA